MRKIYLLLIIICASLGIRAQHVGAYGNEWIDYTPGLVYYKIKVKTDTFYRVPYTVLNASIPNLSSVNPNDLVMYRNGEKVFINVSTTAGAWDTASYIEFYGKHNIGDVDSVLYDKPGMQPTPFYSLFNDTSIYYLTTKAGGNNAHYQYINSDTAAIPSVTEDQYFYNNWRWFYGPTAAAPGIGSTKVCHGTPYALSPDLFKATYDFDEGWGGGYINSSNSPQTLFMRTPSLYTGGPPAVVSGSVWTRSWEPHCFTIKFNSTLINNFTFDNTLGGISHHDFVDTIPISLVNPTTNNALPLQEACGVSTSSNLLMSISVAYPSKYDFGGFKYFKWQMAAGSGERYFRINNVVTTAAQPVIYDITNGYIIKNNDAPAVLPKKFVIPAAAGDRELMFRSDVSNFVRITRMDTVTFQDYSKDRQSKFMIITNRVLRTDSVGHDHVQDYADYRSTRYTTKVYDIDQIMDQYGYGVRKTPLAIRNFVEYAYDHWSAARPEYLFLLGKGRDYSDCRGGVYAYDHNLVPPFGSNPSDNLLACRRGSIRPLIATGRLAAQNIYDVINYLDKVKRYEQQQDAFGDPYQTKEDKLWMKQIMHFSGGTSPEEQMEFRGNLDYYANIAADTLWGAKTSTIYKTTSAPLDNSQADVIRSRINAGVSLMTFFGHAAGTTFDIVIDDPTRFTNYDKFPIIYSNGCQSGDISNTGSTSTAPTPTFGELSVLVPGKCAVAFTATSTFSTSDGLASYAEEAYRAACQYSYNHSWGEALRLAQIAVDSLYPGYVFPYMTATDMTLHGDPALKLNQYPIPDYQVDQSSLYFDPQTVNADMDSFKVNVIVTNLGKAIKDSIQIQISRTYPNPNNNNADTTLVYRWMVKAPYYIDTTFIKIPTFPALNVGFGQNRFALLVESQQRIAELSETNNGNGLNFGLQILSEDILPVYPYEFAIVPNQNPTLKASTINPFAPARTYKIQIDTSELFTHPIAQSNIYQSGGVLHWTVPFQFRDSTVYYWRVSRDSINDSTSFRWHNSSFVYIRNEYPGWNQSHYYQYTHDNFGDNVYLDKDRVFKFKTNLLDVHVATGISNAVGGTIPAPEIIWDLHGVQRHDYRMGGCTPVPYLNGFTVAVIDTITGEPWASYTQGNGFGQYNDINCKPDVQFGFDFPVTTSGTYHGADTLRKFLNMIPNGYPVIIYSVNNVAWTTLDTGLTNQLVSMGATGVRLLRNGAHVPAPYVFFTIKGNPASSNQVIGTNNTGKTEARFNFKVLWNGGTYTSPLIGPSLDWGSVHFRTRQRENPSSDHDTVEIIGYGNNGLPTSLYTTTAPDTLINFISAAQYPYIKLRMHTHDDTTHTPGQLYYWRVLYKKVPEAALNPSAHYSLNRDTLALGDTLNVEVAIENVTDLPMDSLRTLYTLRNQQTQGGVPAVIIKSDSLRAGQTQILKFRQPLNSSILSGSDRLTIEANPVDALHQPEQYHFNNFAFVDFNATSDKVNPLLDVTFDGRRIMSNDLVSAKPDVLITMKDENKSLALNDTSLSQVYIRYPGQTIPQLISYDNNILTFYPATGNIAKNNQAKIAFKPTFTQDGTYDLLIRDQDRSGNFSSNSASGKYQGTSVNGVYYDYKISFNIITKSMISNVLNYPNPFSTRTQFVFTLTGSETPEYMKIQIMTITGKVVKEIQRAELGDIHIGVNRTSYYWDGRDEFGDKLANGVYFYRVITKIDDKATDHMSSTQYGQFFDNTNIDKYFKHGFGKLVIMR